MAQVPRIQIPRPVVSDIPRTVIETTPPPVVRGIQPPVIDVPRPVVEYPIIDVPTEQDFREQMGGGRPEEEQPEEDTRDLPNTPPATSEVPRPTIEIGGIEAPLPEVAPLVTAGATAVVTTSVALGATIALNQVKQVAEPFLRQLLSNRKKKIKIKQVKPVLHYVLNEDKVDIFEYSQKGTKHIDTTEDVERYIRDQVESNSFYEYDNKVIIDESIKQSFTKEGAKRFRSLFAPAKTIAKKLGSKFSF